MRRCTTMQLSQQSHEGAMCFYKLNMSIGRIFLSRYFGLLLFRGIANEKFSWMCGCDRLILKRRLLRIGTTQAASPPSPSSSPDQELRKKMTVSFLTEEISFCGKWRYSETATKLIASLNTSMFLHWEILTWKESSPVCRSCHFTGEWWQWRRLRACAQRLRLHRARSRRSALRSTLRTPRLLGSWAIPIQSLRCIPLYKLQNWGFRFKEQQNCRRQRNYDIKSFKSSTTCETDKKSFLKRAPSRRRQRSQSKLDDLFMDCVSAMNICIRERDPLWSGVVRWLTQPLGHQLSTNLTLNEPEYFLYPWLILSDLWSVFWFQTYSLSWRPNQQPAAGAKCTIWRHKFTYFIKCLASVTFYQESADFGAWIVLTSFAKWSPIVTSLIVSNALAPLCSTIILLMSCR